MGVFVVWRLYLLSKWVAGDSSDDQEEEDYDPNDYGL